MYMDLAVHVHLTRKFPKFPTRLHLEAQSSFKQRLERHQLKVFTSVIFERLGSFQMYRFVYLQESSSCL